MHRHDHDHVYASDREERSHAHLVRGRRQAVHHRDRGGWCPAHDPRPRHARRSVCALLCCGSNDVAEALRSFRHLMHHDDWRAIFGEQ